MATPGTSEAAREPARAGSTGWFLVLTGCGVALRLVALLLAMAVVLHLLHLNLTLLVQLVQHN